MAVEPTEEIDTSRVKSPYLKNLLAKMDELSEDERFDLVKHFDKITVLISPASYVMKFIASEPGGIGGVQYFVQADKARSGLSEDVPNPVQEYGALKEARKDRVQEKLIRNTSWMKDVSRDDVDARKSAFKKALEEVKAVKDNEEEDVEMADS